MEETGIDRIRDSIFPCQTCACDTIFGILNVTASRVEEAVNALSSTYTLTCIEDPTQHPLVKALLDKFGNSLSDSRTLTIFLGFAGFYAIMSLQDREYDITLPGLRV